LDGSPDFQARDREQAKVQRLLQRRKRKYFSPDGHHPLMSAFADAVLCEAAQRRRVRQLDQ